MNSLKGKKLLILGGSSLMCDIIKKAREMDILDTLPEVKSYLPMYQLGDKVELTGTVFQIFMKTSIMAESKDDVQSVLTIINDRIKACDENGNNILQNIPEGDIEQLLIYTIKPHKLSADHVVYLRRPGDCEVRYAA